MAKRLGIILIIASFAMLLYSVCFAGARSVQTTKSPAVSSTATSSKTSPAAITSPKVVVPFGKANLVVSGGVSTAPVKDGMVIPGANMRLGFHIKNAGNKASGNLGTYSIKCTVLSGGKCPVANVNNKKIPNLEPGASKSFTLIQAKAAEKGKYRVTISAQPVNSRGRPRRTEFTVGTLVIKSPMTQGIPATPQSSQPEPPKVKSAKMVTPGTAQGFNPQPEPPKVKSAKMVTPGTAEGFNPQPEPPGTMPMSSQSTVLVMSAEPAAVDLPVGSSRVSIITLEGTNLDKINGIQLVPGSGLTVKFLGQPQPGSRRIVLQATKEALVGNNSLRIVANGKYMDVPLSTFTARVIGPDADDALTLKTPKQSPTDNQPDPEKWSKSGQVLPGSAEGIIVVDSKTGKQSEENEQSGQVLPGQSQGMNPGQPPNPGDPAPLMSKGADGKKN